MIACDACREPIDDVRAVPRNLKLQNDSFRVSISVAPALGIGKKVYRDAHLHPNCYVALVSDMLEALLIDPNQTRKTT
jgi:hypothetical protein